MSALWATFARELRAYFLSPLAYVVLFFVLVLHGAFFSLIVFHLNNPASPAGRPFDIFFSSFPFWMLLIFVVPVVTMRLLAEERKTGSIEVLMTAPVTEGQVVAGKYLAALAFFVALWLPTVLYAVLLDVFGDLDWRTLASGYLGILLIGGLFLSVGVMASAFARNQIVAAVVTFAVNLLVFFVAFLPGMVDQPLLQRAFEHTSILDHMEEFARGIVDTRRLVFYLSTTLFFLFVSARALEDRKWR